MRIPIYLIVAYNNPEQAKELLRNHGYQPSSDIDVLADQCKHFFDTDKATAIEGFMNIHPDRDAFEHFIVPQHLKICHDKYRESIKKMAEKKNNRGQYNEKVYNATGQEQYKVAFKEYLPVVVVTAISLVVVIALASINASKKS